MVQPHVSVEYRATHIPRTENRKLVRYVTTTPRSKNGNVQWSRSECVESESMTIPVDEIAQVIAELASALEAERAEEN